MDTEDEITLSAEASQALKNFYEDRDSRQKQFEDLKARAEDEYNDEADGELVSMETFTEDWNASQFWYDEETASLLAKKLLEGSNKDSWLAVVSAPSVFVQIRRMLASIDSSARPQVRLFEFDTRFEVFKDYIPYDFQQPMRLPGDLKSRFDRIICDPPFLSTDCQTKGYVRTG